MARRRATILIGLLCSAALAAGCEPHVAEHASAVPPSTPAPSLAPVLAGDVVGPGGEPVPGALVSASSHFDLEEPDPPHDVRADGRGHFVFAELPPARYGITATCADHEAVWAGGLTVAKGAPAIHLVLRVGGAGAAIEGTVRDERGAPVDGARVLAPALSENENEVYVARTDERGHYLLRLPTAYGYFVVADAPPRPRAHKQVEPVSQTADLELAAPPAARPSDAEIVAWLRARATPLRGDRDLDDAGARAVAAIAGDAPLVAMGEATHGSAEFAEWRRRVFQALVRDQGFTVYAVETGWAEAFALDDYVVRGTGDARAAIRALVTWKDETEETLALVEWMRAYNADPAHTSKLRFAGFDVLTASAVPALLAYLRKVDPAEVARAAEALAPLAASDADQTYGARPQDEQDRARAAVGALVARMDARREAYAARSSDEAWARGRQLARTIQQAEISFREPGARDEQMAENIRWLVEHAPRGTRFLVDAHGTHVAAGGHGLSSMGRLLRDAWGPRYVAIGFAFGEGSVHALDWRNGPSTARGDFRVPRAPHGTFDGDLSLASLPAFVVDLHAEGGPIGAWLRSPQRMHSIGGRFAGAEHVFESFVPARDFDAVVYVDQVSAIHPLSRAP